MLQGKARLLQADDLVVLARVTRPMCRPEVVGRVGATSRQRDDVIERQVRCNGQATQPAHLSVASQHRSEVNGGARDSLLQSLPVPRFRIPALSIGGIPLTLIFPGGLSRGDQILVALRFHPGSVEFPPRRPVQAPSLHVLCPPPDHIGKLARRVLGAPFPSLLFGAVLAILSQAIGAGAVQIELCPGLLLATADAPLGHGSNCTSASHVRALRGRHSCL